MKDDHCIITKYDLSEREKQIKKNFFSKEKHNESVPANKKEKEVNCKSFIDQENLSEEIVSKFVNDNMKNVNIQTQAFNRAMQQNQGSIPLNLIYSQNKMLERNVDLLGETQRSLHDLLIYNIKTNQNNEAAKLKDEVFRENKKLFTEFLAPVLQNINQLKMGLEHMAKGDRRNEANPNENLNNKVNDMMNRHSDFKEFHANMQKTQKSIDLIEKNKTIQQTFSKDNPVMKTIEEVKSSVSGLNQDMKNLEDSIKESLKKIIENQERKNLIGGNQQLSHGSFGGFSKKGGFSAKSEDYFDYLDAKIELNDIMQKSNEIFNEFNNHKYTIPKKKITDKINFSYKLDFEDETDSTMDSTNKNKPINKGDIGGDKAKNHTKNASSNNVGYIAVKDYEDGGESSDYQNNKSNNKSNVFLHNYEEKKPKVSLSKESKDNNNLKQDNKSKKQQTLQPSNKNQNKQPQKEDVSPGINKNLIERNNEINTNNNPNLYKVEESMNIFSTKHTDQNLPKNPNVKIPTETLLETKSQDKLITIPENLVKKVEGQTEKVLQKVTEEQKNIVDHVTRKGIKEVEVDRQSKDKFELIEDIITKLCVEKILNQTNKKTKLNHEYLPEEKITVGGEVENLFGCQPYQVSSISENLMRDKIRSLLKFKKTPPELKLSVSKDVNLQFNEDNLNKRFKNEMDRKEFENQKLLQALMEKIDELSKNNPKQVENVPINVNEIVDKVSNQLKGNLHINVNLKQESIEKKPEPIVFKMKPSIKKTEPDKVEEYVNPFNYKYQPPEIKYDEVQVPHMINLSEYDVSSVSGLSDSKISKRTPRKQNEEADESLSDGQILKTISTPVSRSQYFSPEDYEAIELRGTGQMKNNLTKKQMNGTYFTKNEMLNDNLKQYEESLDDTDQVSLQSDNLRKFNKTGKIDINNTNMLKNLNLYESGEHMKFQKEFGGQQSVTTTQKNQTQRMDELINNAEVGSSQRSEFINFGPTQRSGGHFSNTGLTQRSNNTNNNNMGFKFIKNTTNPPQNFQSFGNENQNYINNNTNQSNNINVNNNTSHSFQKQNMSPDDADSSNNMNSFKLHKVNKEEIEKLKKMEKNLKERMKTIASNSASEDNTENQEESNR